jgi:CelD/BcsL family acetyltransferase involved in cellulose biosynthesis
LPVFTPAVLPGAEESVLAAAVEWLITVAGCDAVSLSPLSGESNAVHAAEAVAARRGLQLARSDDRGPHTVFRFPASFDEYLASLSKSARQDHRRFERHLQRDFHVEYRVLTGAAAIACFDEFVALHVAHWKPRGKPGHFADWPDGERFNRDLVTRMAADDRVRFYVITSDGSTLSMEYCFVLGDRCFWRLPARDTDPELEKLRLGRVGLAEMFRVLIEHGTTMVEAGPGHYDYKVRLGGVEHRLRRVIIARDSRWSLWKIRLVVRWADLVHLVYYRIWFNHLAARVGRSGKRLWGPWVRTRL